MSDAGADQPDSPDHATALTDIAHRLHDLASSEGAPEAGQTAADLLPGMTTGNVLYDFSASLSLAIGDLASAVESLLPREAETR